MLIELKYDTIFNFNDMRGIKDPVKTREKRVTTAFKRLLTITVVLCRFLSQKQLSEMYFLSDKLKAFNGLSCEGLRQLHESGLSLSKSGYLSTNHRFINDCKRKTAEILEQVSTLCKHLHVF